MRLFNETDAIALGDMWVDKPMLCFICGRPTQYVDLSFQGPLCGTVCEEWACTDAAWPPIKQGPRPEYKP